MKKLISVLLFAAIMVTMVYAAGAAEAAGSSSQRVVTTVCRASYAEEEWYKAMNAAFEAETGIHVDVQPTPGNDADHDAKVNIDLMAGGKIDVIPSLGPKYYYDRADSGFFAALDELFKAKGIDAEDIWGLYLPTSEDGHVYGVPYKQEMFCVFYNKDIFDAAGVAYPQGNWTWDDYVKIATKLTDASKGIYGSFMSMTSPWVFIQAKQNNVPLYKADGTCNFDDPAFAEAIQWYKSLGNELKIQMPVSAMKDENVSWNYYAIAGDHLAMFVQGNWFTRLLNSQADYPRDWKYGVTVVPSAGANGANNIVSMGYYSINKNAEHIDEAVEYLVWLSKNEWRYEGQVPALRVLSEEDQSAVFASIADASTGQVTVSDLYSSLVDTGLGAVPQDIVGTAASEYTTIINEEVQAFCLDMQSLETTVANICKRVNEAIKNVQ